MSDTNVKTDDGRTKSTEAYRKLRTMIKEGRLAHGQPLTESEAARLVPVDCPDNQEEWNDQADQAPEHDPTYGHDPGQKLLAMRTAILAVTPDDPANRKSQVQEAIEQVGRTRL